MPTYVGMTGWVPPMGQWLRQLVLVTVPVQHTTPLAL
jgi:hypothetical protein